MGAWSLIFVEERRKPSRRLGKLHPEMKRIWSSNVPPMRARSLLAAAAIGYLLGTFPTADLVARRASAGRVDLRRSGSGNPGTMNAVNVLGAKAGAAVLVGDLGKGALASVVGGAVAGPVGAHVGGSASVIGHCYPAWNGFRGGKGVAASVGQCLVTFPAYFPIDLAVGAATAAMPWWRQRAFGATMVSSACWVAGGVVWWRRGWNHGWGPTPSAALPIAAAVSSAVIAERFAAGQRSQRHDHHRDDHRDDHDQHEG